VLPFDAKQSAEIWITAAQSLFALSIIVNFRISLRESVTLFSLFVSQVFLEFLLIRDLVELPVTSRELLLVFTALYLVLAAGLLFARRQALFGILGQFGRTVRAAFSDEVERQPAD
jgi:cation:H+ antiporter